MKYNNNQYDNKIIYMKWIWNNKSIWNNLYELKYEIIIQYDNKKILW